MKFTVWSSDLQCTEKIVHQLLKKKQIFVIQSTLSNSKLEGFFKILRITECSKLSNGPNLPQYVGTLASFEVFFLSATSNFRQLSHDDKLKSSICNEQAWWWMLKHSLCKKRPCEYNNSRIKTTLIPGGKRHRSAGSGQVLGHV